MARENRKRTFSSEYLQQIKNEKNSCVELKRDTLHITVHPFQLKDFASSLKELLSRRITRYNKQLGGILLGHDNIVLQTSNGVINNDSCYIHMNMEGDFYVFKPEVGRLLKGVVNKKSRSHVGCLVYQLFNVSLPRQEYEEEWLGDNVAVGQEIIFKIVDTNLNRKLPYIRGEIISILTDSDSGISTSEEKQIAGDSASEDEEPKKKKKHKHKEMQEATTPSRKKKRSHHEVADESVVDVNSADEFEVSKKHKKKRHSKGEKSVEREEVTVEADSKKRKRWSIESEEAETSVNISSKKKKRKRNDSD